MNSKYYFRSYLTTSVESGDLKVRFTIAFHTEGRFDITATFRSWKGVPSLPAQEGAVIRYIEALDSHKDGFFSAVHILDLRRQFGIDSFSLKASV